MAHSLLFLLLHFLPSAKWTEFKDFEGKFSVKIPCATMTPKVQTIKTPLGDLKYHSFYCTPTEDEAENKVYLISYVDYPEGVLHRDSLELRKSLFEETINSAVESVNGQLMYQDNVELKEVQGKFWRIDYNKGNAVMKSRAFIVANRFYVVQVATTKARSRNLEADKFLESFRWF
jgi:hypothetical protein